MCAECYLCYIAVTHLAIYCIQESSCVTGCKSISVKLSLFTYRSSIYSCCLYPIGWFFPLPVLVRTPHFLTFGPPWQWPLGLIEGENVLSGYRDQEQLNPMGVLTLTIGSKTKKKCVGYFYCSWVGLVFTCQLFHVHCSWILFTACSLVLDKQIYKLNSLRMGKNRNGYIWLHVLVVEHGTLIRRHHVMSLLLQALVVHTFLFWLYTALTEKRVA